MDLFPNGRADCNIVRLTPLPRDRETSIGLGIAFKRNDTGARVPGDWALHDIKMNYQYGKMHVPCAQWSDVDRAYFFFMRED